MYYYCRAHTADLTCTTSWQRRRQHGRPSSQGRINNRPCVCRSRLGGVGESGQACADTWTSAATRSAATRSAATRSAATRSAATRSAATRSAATRSAATLLNKRKSILDLRWVWRTSLMSENEHFLLSKESSNVYYYNYSQGNDIITTSRPLQVQYLIEHTVFRTRWHRYTNMVINHISVQ